MARRVRRILRPIDLNAVRLKDLHIRPNIIFKNFQEDLRKAYVTEPVGAENQKILRIVWIKETSLSSKFRDNCIRVGIDEFKSNHEFLIQFLCLCRVPLIVEFEGRYFRISPASHLGIWVRRRLGLKNVNALWDLVGRNSLAETLMDRSGVLAKKQAALDEAMQEKGETESKARKESAAAKKLVGLKEDSVSSAREEYAAEKKRADKLEKDLDAQIKRNAELESSLRVVGEKELKFRTRAGVWEREMEKQGMDLQRIAADAGISYPS